MQEFQIGERVIRTIVTGPVMTIVNSSSDPLRNLGNTTNHKYICEWQEGSQIRFGIFKSADLISVDKMIKVPSSIEA